ncbi:MAG: hypothetical protein AB1633_06875 [Elusimicrobiota bacterium]
MRLSKSLLSILLFCGVSFSQLSTGETPWTDQERDEFSRIPLFELPLAKLVPWKDDVDASKINLRDRLMQNDAAIKYQDCCGSCVTNSIVAAMEYVVKRELILNDAFNFSK